jgi:hypothetical protein
VALEFCPLATVTFAGFLELSFSKRDCKLEDEVGCWRLMTTGSSLIVGRGAGVSLAKAGALTALGPDVLCTVPPCVADFLFVSNG